MKWKKYKGYLKRGIILSSIFLVLYMTIFVKAFEDYEVTQSNDFQIEVKQKRASSSSTGTKYSTAGWYIFKEETGAGEHTKTENGTPINATYYNTYGFKLTTGTENLINSTKEDENGVFYDTFQFDAEKIVPAVLEWYKENGVVDRQALIDGITVYANRSLNVVVNGKVKSTHYNYEDIAKQAGWSSGTLNAFKDSYDKQITLQFHAVDFSIEIIDETGELPEDYENVKYQDIPNQLLYGESVNYSYPGEISGYEYVGFEWRAGDVFGEVVQSLKTGTSTGAYTIGYKETIDANGLVLVFRYEKLQPPPTETPVPTNTPTPTPEPTLPIGITATPTPLPTNTPTPLPTATPVPTELPTKDLYVVYNKRYYFSTDEGYTISKIVTNTSYDLCSSKSVTGAGKIYSSNYTKRDKSYCIGYDEQGNEWYFIPNETTATYVHPSVYQGYRIDSEEVKYVKELVFPYTITYEGNSYTVVSIGGGTAKYKTKKQDYKENWNDTTDFGSEERWNYGIERGRYYYEQYTQNADRTYTVTYLNEISYTYGIVGNGNVESVGGNKYVYTNGTEKERDFNMSYYVYNTTLESVTIPDTVTNILPYAFYGCQALTEIKGGDNVLYIEEYALEAIKPKLSYSEEWIENSYKNYDMYYYNDSYSMIVGTYTDTMVNWEQACQLSSYLRLPKFPKLSIIGKYAFLKRKNLYDVVLSDSVREVEFYAFEDCMLQSITIPGINTKVNASLEQFYTTLGTNGTGEDRTIIYTVPNSGAMAYGLYYSNYYRLKSGYPVIYESNGAGQDAKSYSSDVFREEDKISYKTIIYGNMFSYDGYRFINWNTKADGSGVTYIPTQEVVLEDSLVLYAQWKPRNAMIRYDKNGGSGTMPDTILQSEETSVTLPSNTFTRKGYCFIGWNTKADGTGVSYIDKDTVSHTLGVLILYAQWEKVSTSYTLLYMKYPYGTKGNVVWKQKVLEYDSLETVEGEPFTSTGNKVAYDMNISSTMSTIPNALQLTEKNTKTKAPLFDKWQFYKRNDNGTMIYQGKQYQSGTMISALTKQQGEVCYFYPKWRESGASVLLPLASCEGYYLEGWSEYQDGTGDIYYVQEEESEEDIGTFTPIKDTTLYAIWSPEKKNIMLDGQGADEQVQTEVIVTFDKVAPTVVIPTRKQYVFQGYYTGVNGTGVKVIEKDGTGSVIINNKNGCFDEIDTLYAYWIPEKQIIYHPNYSPLDSNCPNMEVTWIEEGKTGTYLSKNLFTKTGHHFVCWNTKADGSGISYNDGQYIDNVTTRITLYAQWDKNTYKVHYADDVYENHPEISDKEEDIWTYDEIYIIKEQPYIKQDIVTYHLNQGNKSTMPQMVTNLTKEYTNSIYAFIGYRLYEKTNSGYVKTEQLFQVGEEVSNLTLEDSKVFVLFPEWEKISNGVLLPNASCNGYSFYGWVTNITETNKENIVKSPYITTKDITLYAYWTPKQYEVMLNDRGATSKEHDKKVTFTFDEKGNTIKVPTKTGYTFQGYYTGTRGTGTKYYDKNGACIKVWTEEQQEVLYAYWIQDKVEFPKEEPKVEPEVLPTMEYKGEISRNDAKVLLYADDYNDATGALDDLQPYLTYATGQENGKIPSTEQLAIRAKMGAWMLSYHLRRVSGKDYVRIYVTVPYRTQYEKEDETLVISEQKKKTYEIVVPKVWSYWEIVESGLYYPKSVIIKNQALEHGQEEIIVKDINSQSLLLPEYEVNAYKKEEHISWEKVDTDGKGKLEIVLMEEQYIISDVIGQEPNVERYLSIVCTNAAWKDDRQCNVKSDSIIFDGSILLSDELQTTGHGCEVNVTALPKDNTKIKQTGYEQAYISGVEIKDTIANGQYKTSAYIQYVGDEKNIGVVLQKISEVSDVNSLQIHTPVACQGVLVDEIQEQEIYLKESLNFFSLKVSNVGTHSACLGYGTKDFSIALSGVSNIAMEQGECFNQVKFPFDVFVDRNGDTKETNQMEDDLFVTARTWITIGKEKVWFYVPVTQENGRYVVEFRSIAVNCPKNALGDYVVEGTTEQNVNLKLTNYIATDAMELVIQSYMEDFEIVHTNDPEAVKKLQQGIQALQLKKGYEFSYQLFTKGMFDSEEGQIQIIPSYYWVSEDEKEREEVNLYYQPELGKIEKLLYTPEVINLPTKYCELCGTIAKGEELLSCGHSSTEFSKWTENMVQQWKGTFYLPSNVFCIAVDIRKGYCTNCNQIRYVSGGKNCCSICQTVLEHQQVFDYEQYTKVQTLHGQEEFLKKTGYVVVSFDIRVKSNQGTWYVFETWEETKLAKDAIELGWNYIAGDVIRYDLSRSMAEDYEVGGIE